MTRENHRPSSGRGRHADRVEVNHTLPGNDGRIRRRGIRTRRTEGVGGRGKKEEYAKRHDDAKFIRSLLLRK